MILSFEDIPTINLAAPLKVNCSFFKLIYQWIIVQATAIVEEHSHTSTSTYFFMTAIFLKL